MNPPEPISTRDARAELIDALAHQLDALREQDNLRSLRPLTGIGKHIEHDGQRYLNLAGNDYLALADHPHLKRAAQAAIEQHGTGATASRLICGTLDLHTRVEARFAAFKHAQAALLLPTGFMANLALLTTLAGPDDLILQDKLNHASLIDASRASGAQVRTFAHLDYARLEQLLQRKANETAARNGRVFLVSDSVFSMDGDTADLPTLCDLAERYGAHVIIDEAHGTGVLGETGAGLAELQGVGDRVFAMVSTASKALGGLGGIVTGPRVLIDTLVNSARSFIYTTGTPPALAAAINAALDVARDEPHRREHLRTISRELRERLMRRGWDLGADSAQPAGVITPILPLIVGGNAASLNLSARLLDAGIASAPIRPPTVPPNAARVRLSLRADLDDADLDRITDAVGRP